MFFRNNLFVHGNDTNRKTVNQQILAAIKFGVSQNKVIWRARLCSVRSTYMLVATNISENTQFAKFAKYNSTPKFVDLQELFCKLTQSNYYTSRTHPGDFVNAVDGLIS